MNRHERRARAAGADLGFEQYRRTVLRHYSKVSEREIGEAWMRAAAWSASRGEAMVIHARGEPRDHRDDEMTIAATYGDFSFKPFAEPDLVSVLVGDWETLIEKLNWPDPRRNTRSAIIEMLAEHRHVDGDSQQSWRRRCCGRLPGRWALSSRAGNPTATCTTRSPTSPAGKASAVTTFA